MLLEPIKVDGLAKFVREAKKVSDDLPKAVRLVNNEAANIVVKYSLPLVPTKSGAARKSIKASSTRTSGRVKAGSTKVPYYPWLDFGGSVGRKGSVKRPFIAKGRILYPAYINHQKEIYEVLVAALTKLCNDSGIGVGR